MNEALLDATLVGETGALPPAAAAGAPVLVLGVGNLLMGDEGVGVHILRQLERLAPVPGVRLLDGGTGGVNLLAEFDGVRAVILVDATRDGQPAGTVSYRRPALVRELPHGLSAHDFGLKDLFAACALLGRLPDLHLCTVSVETVRPMCTELSPEVAATVAPVAAAVRDLARGLAQRGAPTVRRPGTDAAIGVPEISAPVQAVGQPAAAGTFLRPTTRQPLRAPRQSLRSQPAPLPAYSPATNQPSPPVLPSRHLQPLSPP